MIAYVFRRLLQAVPLLIGISFIAFVILRLAPGGPMGVYAQNPSMTEADMKRIERLLGLDQPIQIQYVKWAAGTLTGHLGYSYRTGRPVGAVIAERVPATLELMTSAYVVAIVLGIVTGVVSAVKRYSVFDYVATPVAIIGLSIPIFWFGLLVIIFFASALHWIPSGGIATLGAPFSLRDRLAHLAGPAGVLGLWMTAAWSRYCRSSVLEVLGQDYVRTARAKGLRERSAAKVETPSPTRIRKSTGSLMPGYARSTRRSGRRSMPSCRRCLSSICLICPSTITSALPASNRSFRGFSQTPTLSNRM